MAKLFGTEKSDTLVAVESDTLFFGSLGKDTFEGGVGRDTVIYDSAGFLAGVVINNTDRIVNGIAPLTVWKGEAGIDTLRSIEAFHGTNFDDVIFLGLLPDYVFDRGGDDAVFASGEPGALPVFFGAGSGSDRFSGSSAIGDTISYYGTAVSDAAGLVLVGVRVNLAAGEALDPWGNTDTLSGIEHAWGTHFDDWLTGDAGYNLLRGWGGDDLLEGGGGNDDLDGGNGDDTLVGGDGDSDEADYSRDKAGIVADLSTDTVIDGWGSTDTLIGIESVRGSAFEDILRGGARDDWLRGDAGDDLVEGGGGDDLLEGGAGNDTLDGGEGNDRVLYLYAPRAVDVALNEGRAVVGEEDVDILIGIEQVAGSEHADRLVGADGQANQFDGWGGNDTLVGGDGAGTGNALRGGMGNDLLIGGDGAANYFEPGTGNDRIEGGAGALNELSYDHDPSGEGDGQGIRVHFGGTDLGRVIDHGGRTDLFEGVTMIRGTVFADAFNGGPGNQTFRGLAGNDTLNGGAGGGDRADYSLDAVDGAVGVEVDLARGTARDGYGDKDRLVGIEDVLGTAANDVLRGAAGAETLDGGAGDDTLEGGGGDDFLRGGAGQDLALYGGQAGDHVITIYGGRAAIDVADKRAQGNGFDGLEGIETLGFATGPDLSLVGLAGAASLGAGQAMRLVEVYLAYFDRAPDALGLLYWGTRLAEGMTLAQIAESFAEQEETRAMLPEGASSAAMVDAAYANLFERKPDRDGKAFWIDALDSGDVGRGAFLLALIDGARGPEGDAGDVAVIEAKAQIGWRYAVDYGLTDTGRAAEAMAAYDTAKPVPSLDAVEGMMAEFRDAAIAEGSDELVIRIGAFGEDPFDL